MTTANAKTHRQAHAAPASKHTKQAKNASKSVARQDVDDGLSSDSTSTATKDALKPLPKSGVNGETHGEEFPSTDDDVSDLRIDQREQAIRDRSAGS
jgi:hypothetical protein